MELPSKRAKNFREEECKLILELVKAKKDIIENKKTDSVSAKEKEENLMKRTQSLETGKPLKENMIT